MTTTKRLSLLALLLPGVTALHMHAADEAEKLAPTVPGENLRNDVEAAALTPDFATVVVKGGGLWPQLHCAPDGTLLALGYNAPGHTTLPGDVDCWGSTDGGKTWSDEGLLTGFHKHPPSLVRLKDRRLVLTYGNRRNGNIEARLSKDDGRMWDAPRRLFQVSGDMGYPSTVQLPDGCMVTVFYAKQSTLHDGYHMGAIRWQVPQEAK